MGIATAVDAREAPGAIARRRPGEIAGLIKRAKLGDQKAWAELAGEFKGLLQAIARGHRLSDADAADIAQITWLRLVENLDALKDPSRVGAWLATTARRECPRIVRNSARELPDDEPPEPAGGAMPPLDADLLVAERTATLRSAFRRLPARDQALLGMLVADPQPSYEEIGPALEMSIGSIGPTRGRALERLRLELKRSGTVVDLAGC